MDKETLSNYGWIVICVLVLAVMIALASPFGKFVSGAVQSTTQGLFDVNQSALGAAGIEIMGQEFEDALNSSDSTGNKKLVLEPGAVIPEGCTYYVGLGDIEGNGIANVGDYSGATATYTAGQCMPEINSGDVFVCGEYEYRYNMIHYGNDQWSFPASSVWGVVLLDTEKTEYAPLFSSINGKDVRHIDYLFSCTNIITAPDIPDTVTNIGGWAFFHCENLTSVTIPNTVTNIGDFAFKGCYSLTSITYNGTIAEWNAISKGDNWNTSTGDYTIHCTDGDIAKS